MFKSITFSLRFVLLSLLVAGHISDAMSWTRTTTVDGIKYKIFFTGEEADAVADSAWVCGFKDSFSGVANIPELLTFEYTWHYWSNGSYLAVTENRTTRVLGISQESFYKCTALTSCSIPNSVRFIGTKAFYGCSGLTEMTIPNPVYFIGSEAFCGCSALTDVNLSNSVTVISNSMFKNCYNLQNVLIPESVTVIADNAFESCYGLTNVTIGNSVTKIGDAAFSSCQKLAEVVIPNSVTSIGNDAFKTCIAMTRLSLGSTVTTIGSSAFSDCQRLAEVIIPNSVTSIGESAFASCDSLKYLTIGESVSSIGQDAFLFINLKEITWNAKHCESIGDYSTWEVEKVTIGNKVEYLPDYFLEGSQITEVTIPNSVVTIGKYAFAFCRLLEGISIPSTVTAIHEGAFDCCVKLTEFTLPNSISTIEPYLFAGCSGLTSFTIPCTISSIGKYAFSQCTGLTSVTIPSSVTSIGEYAFRNCTGLTEVTISEPVSRIYNCAFYHCDSLKTLYWNARNCDYIYDYGGSRQSGAPFFYCDALEHIVIGEGVEYIDDDMFYYVSASRVTSKAKVPPVITSACFYYLVTDYAKLCVPNESLDIYRDAEGWKLFKNIMCETNFGDVNGDGSINIADVAELIDLLLNGGEMPLGVDVDGDGKIDIADVAALIDMLLSGNN